MEQPGPSRWNKVRDQMGFSHERMQAQNYIEEMQTAFGLRDIDSNVASMTETTVYVQRNVGARPPDKLSMAPYPMIEEDGVSWGTKDEVDELNRSVKQCLEIEGLKPDSFFIKDEKDFPSLTEFYIDLHKRLLPAEIDFFVSIYSLLTPTHPLVKSMKRILDSNEYKGPRYDLDGVREEEPIQTKESPEGPRTLLTKEPTIIQQEAEDLAQRTVLPGIHSFGEECRTYSWVVRINPPNNQQTPPRPPPQPVNQTPLHIPGLQAPLTPISGSVGPRTVTSAQSHGCPEVIPIVNTISSTAYTAARPPERVVTAQAPYSEQARCFPRLRKFFCFSA